MKCPYAWRQRSTGVVISAAPSKVRCGLRLRAFLTASGGVLDKSFHLPCIEIVDRHHVGSRESPSSLKDRGFLSLGFEDTGCRHEVNCRFTRLCLDLRLTQSVIVPGYIPKPQWKHYSDAKLAFNCNQILPALFLLRTLVEQYTLFLVPGEYKAGENLCAAYNATLDEDFKARFPSFADVYNVTRASGNRRNTSSVTTPYPAPTSSTLISLSV